MSKKKDVSIELVRTNLIKCQNEFESASRELEQCRNNLSDALTPATSKDLASLSDIISVIYWSKSLPTDILRNILGISSKELLNCIQPKSLDIRCEKCNSIMSARSLCDLQNKTTGKNKDTLCDKCKRDRGIHFITEYYKEPEPKKMSRLEELKTMDYVDYLQTDEWYKTRAIALKKASYRCSKCGKNRTEIELHVHHKTYIRRGEERQSDLIVLCSDCHKALHFGGNA